MVLQCMENRNHHACMRVDFETWYVMRLHYDLDEENNIKTMFKQIRVVKLVNGCYLVCSCILYANIGIGCVHISTMIDDMAVHFWHVMQIFYHFYVKKLLPKQNHRLI